MPKTLNVATATILLHLFGFSPLLCNKILAGPSAKKNDNYEIRWQGKSKGKVYLSYSIATNLTDPVQVESLTTTLPKTVKFSAPPGSSVSAGSLDVNVTVRIFRNGRECGKITVVSKTQKIPQTKVCI